MRRLVHMVCYSSNSSTSKLLLAKIWSQSELRRLAYASRSAQGTDSENLPSVSASSSTPV